MTAGYYRFPTIHEQTLIFVSEDDLWTVSLAGGIARRLTSNLGSVTYPMLSPDGEWLAFVGREEGAPEVYVMPAGGGSARRLTYLSSSCRVVGWEPNGAHILLSSTYGQVVPSEYGLFRVAADAPNGAVEALPYGPARTIAFGPNDEIVLGRNTGDPARWKRYRGGTAGHLWIGRDGEFAPLLPHVQGNIASPMWIRAERSGGAGERIFFVSDHEGIGNLYSCAPDGTDLRRHTDHEDYYVRNPSSDGARIAYHAGADLYVYDIAADTDRRIDVDYRSPRVQRNRRFVSSRRYLSDATLHPSGQALTVNTRGKAYTFYNHEGPVYQHGVRDGVRYRAPLWFNDGRRVLLVSDEPGEETLEIHTTEPNVAPVQLAGLDIGRPLAMRMSPRADRLALTNHRHELLLVDLTGLDGAATAAGPNGSVNDAAAGDRPADDEPGSSNGNRNTDGSVDESALPPGAPERVTVVDRSPHRVIAGLDWSPDGRWLAYGYGATTHTTEIRLHRLPDPTAEDEELRRGSIHTVTKPVLHDTGPAFDPDGRFLYFLSRREFNPVYDALHFDLSFPWGMRPYLLTLQADQANPFVPRPDTDEDWGDDADEETDDADAEDDEAAAANDAHDAADDRDADEDDENGDEDYEDYEDDESGEDGEDDEAERDAVGRAGSDAPHLLPLDSAKSSAESKSAATREGGSDRSAELRIDLENIERRVLAFPVTDARYGQIAGVPGKALFTVFPVEGMLDVDAEWEDDEEEEGTLRAYDFKEYKTETLASNVNGFEVSRNRKKLLYFSGRQLRVIKAGEKAPGSSGPPRKTGWIDLNRVKVSVDPPREWQQMMREAWRLQRDHFWTEDMSQVDWPAVFMRYYPLIERVSTRSEFSDLLWEMQGELGTSHAYEIGGDYRPAPYYDQGFLGAELTWNAAAGGYEVGEMIPGDSWDPEANSPLLDPGVDVKPGDIIVAINGQPLDAETGPAQLLVNHAGSEVLLTLLPRPDNASPNGATPGAQPTGQDASSASSSVDGAAEHPGRNGTRAAPGTSSLRMVAVKTLHSEAPARYRAWVEGNRRYVHDATDGRVGYVHIPDMGARGYAEFHRGYLAETDRDGLIVDVRYNGGGHVSQLILEKLARRRIGYDMARWSSPTPYPMDSVAGPLVALTNEHAASDGDIFCHGFKLMQLGPLIGKRTWGGVIGISARTSLVDGTVTTQPEYSFWFEDVGWGVENYGTEPDIDVDVTPQDYAAGRDPQLERAIAEALRLLGETDILKPDLNNRPRLPLPKLPPRA